VLKFLIRGSALQILAFAVDVGASFLLMPFLIHSLGDQGYGSWAIISTIVGQVGLMDLGLASTTQRFIAYALGRKNIAEISGIYTTSIIMLSLMGCVAMLLILAILPFAPIWYAQAGHEREFQYALAIAGLNFSFSLPFSVLSGSLLAKLRMDAVATCRMAETAARLGLTYLAVNRGYGIIGVAGSSFVAVLMGRVLLGVVKHRIAPEISFSLPSASQARARELVRFGKYVFVIRIGDMFRYRLDNLIIAPFLGLSAVTHYSVAVRLSDYLQSLILRIVALPGPIFVMHAGRNEIALIRDKFLLVSEIGAGMLGIAVGGVLIFGKRFIDIWLGPGFDSSFYVLVILTAGMFFALLQTPSRDVLGAIYKHPFDAKSNTIEAIVNIALTLALIPRFGILGAAVGTAVPMIVTKGIILPHYVCREIGLPIGRYLVAIGRPLTVALAVSVSTYAVLPLDRTHSLLVLICAGGVFAVIASFAVFVSFSHRCREILGYNIRELVWERKW
jgi:O-antigen/teichoic acid export membrane protein